MKRGLYIALISLILFAVLAFAGCNTSSTNNSGTQVGIPHVHNFVVSITQPTCIEKGYSTHTCECGESYIDSYVSVLDHIPQAAVRENVSEATCKNEGSYDEVVYCSVCNKKISSVHKVVNKTEHNYVDNICIDCGDEQIQYHTHNFVSQVTNPTCIERGYTTHMCGCGESYIDSYVSALDHKPDTAVSENEVKATCTADGSYDEVVYCSVCNEKLSSTHKTVNKTGHKPQEAVRENEIKATCERNGGYDYVVYCSVCNIKLSSTHNTTEKIPHNFVGGVCTECGYDVNVPHSHNYLTVLTLPDCTTNGYTTYTCECGESYVADYVSATGHTNKSVVIENKIEASCISDGGYDEVVYCSVCNEKLSSTHKTDSKTGHKPQEAVRENEVKATCTTSGSYDEIIYCSVCHGKISEIHSFVTMLSHKPQTAVRENEVDSTCTQEGHYDEVVYCSECETEISRAEKIIEKKAHSPLAAVREKEVDSTCTQEGHYDEVVYCSECETELSRTEKVIEKKVHSPLAAVRENEVDSTCTQEGHYDEVVYCSECETEISRTEKVIEKKVHSPLAAVQENEVDSTCTQEGHYDEVVYCSECETEISRAEKVIEKKVHSPLAAVRENEVDSTCTQEGYYDEVVYCGNCNFELTRTVKSKSILPHDFDNGICVICSAIEPPTFELLVFTLLENNTYEVKAKDTTVSHIVIPSIYEGYPVTAFGREAFKNCKNLESIIIPESIITIGNSAFSGCTNLSSINFPDSVLTIGSSAFANCFGLTNIVIPDSVITIGSSAFWGCSGLTNIIIPNNVTTIGDSAFRACTKLESITLPFIGNSLNGTSNTHFGYIFFGNDFEQETHMYEALKSVIITGNNGLTKIDSYAFQGCRYLTYISIPNTITSIGHGAFAGCGIINFVIPEGVTEIDAWAFYNCANLTNIVIPATVTKIGAEAFGLCNKLAHIYYKGTVTELERVTFSKNDFDENVTRIDFTKIYYYSETQPTEKGNYWHYVDDKFIVW